MTVDTIIDRLERMALVAQVVFDEDHPGAGPHRLASVVIDEGDIRAIKAAIKELKSGNRGQAITACER